MPSKYFFHQVPFPRGRQVRIGTLALGYVCFPFGLSRQGGKTCHVAFPIEIIHRVTNHKDMVFKTIYLHIKNADGTLSFNYLGPHVSVEFTIFLDKFRVVDEFEGLAIAFHFFSVLVINKPYNTMTMKQIKGKIKLRFTEAMLPMPPPSMIRACKGGSTEPPKMAMISPAAPILASSPVSVPTLRRTG